MPDKNKCLPVGNFTRTHGARGGIVLWLQKAVAEEMHESEWIFVETDGLLVPFLVTEIREMDSLKLVISLDGITTESAAKELVGSTCWITGKGAAGKNPKKPGRKDLTGFTVLDDLDIELGQVIEILEISDNPLLKIRGVKEFLVPYHPDIILEISEKKKILKVKLVDGLMDL
jgi:16S rRNA processing protein RimM